MADICVDDDDEGLGEGRRKKEMRMGKGMEMEGCTDMGYIWQRSWNSE